MGGEMRAQAVAQWRGGHAVLVFITHLCLAWDGVIVESVVSVRVRVYNRQPMSAEA